MWLRDKGVGRVFAPLTVALCIGTIAPTSWSRDITLDQAMDIALTRTSRSSVIKGDLEVAEANYFARRINFYVPEISINGSLPSYAEDESYRFFYGSPLKQLYRTNDFGASSFIQLKQSLITGGGLTVKANLTANKSEYPNTSAANVFFNETNRQGFFQFSLEQPLLKPSDSKFELNNRRDDVALAKLTRAEEETQLKKDVINGYVGALQTALKADIAGAKLESARLKEDVDSSKLQDGVISEDTWLETSSARIDAELNQFDSQTQLAEQNRQLAALLDLQPSDSLHLFEPVLVSHPTDLELAAVVNRWESCIAIQKADLQYKKANRAAGYSAGGHGLSGSLLANYSLGRGRVKVDGGSAEDNRNDNINTNSWDVALNLTFPIWDGGSSSASVKASRITAEKSRLEFEKAQRAARAEIEALVNKYNVSYRKLAVLRQQIQLAETKLKIAEERMNNGEISRVAYLDARVFLLEARNKYLEELKNYLLSKADLDGKFAS